MSGKKKTVRGPELADAAATAAAAIINLALMRPDRLFMGRCTAAPPVVHTMTVGGRLLCNVIFNNHCSARTGKRTEQGARKKCKQNVRVLAHPVNVK